MIRRIAGRIGLDFVVAGFAFANHQLGEIFLLLVTWTTLVAPRILFLWLTLSANTSL